MHYDSKRQDLVKSPKRGTVTGYYPGAKEAHSADLVEQWPSEADIRECVQILEEVFQKFEVDVAIADDLGPALMELAEQERRAAGHVVRALRIGAKPKLRH